MSQRLFALTLSVNMDDFDNHSVAIGKSGILESLALAVPSIALMEALWHCHQ